MNSRQARVAALEALDRRVRQFRGREELWPLRTPSEPILLDEVMEEALGDAARHVDVESLRSRTLLATRYVVTRHKGAWRVCAYEPWPRSGWRRRR